VRQARDGSMPARVVVSMISVYRRFVSPLLGRHCRYEPTCSRYAMDAISVHGAAKGGTMALRRIGRCHPWAPGGFDPVPLERSEG
jgi:putative membrane protein insertion efficiency factor